jgi:hypothetical protein
MMVRGMIERHQAATICVDRPGRAVLAALLVKDV